MPSTFKSHDADLEKHQMASVKDNGNAVEDRNPAIADNEDALRLAQLGHAQELRREYSLFSLGALCVCLMATWEALSTVIATALINGGAPCLFYNYVLSAICSLCIASSLGEIASMYPTAGGQYHWVAALTSSRIRTPVSFMTGWTCVGGQIVLTASAAFAAGLQAQALVIVNDSAYIPQRWQGLLFYWDILSYAFVLNVWGHRALPLHNTVSGIIHAVGFFAIVIVLGVMAHKNPASFVFTEVTNYSGWKDDGVSWLVGLLSAVYPFLGYDAACHLAEEMPNASQNVPIAMVGSVGVNALIGLVYVIVLLFSTGSLETLLKTPTGYPFIQIFLDATKSNVGTTLLSLIIVCIATAATVAGVTSTSRTLWAFARDKSTPFDKHLSKVNERLQIPVYAVSVTTGLQMLLGFIYLGNTTAFNAFLSMAIIGMYISYALPIIAMLFARRRLVAADSFGPFKLGQIAGPLLNVISLVWITIVVVFSTFPSALPVTAQNMNYSIVVMSGWTLAGALYYLLRASAKYQVPTVGLDIVDGVQQSN